MGRLNLPPDHSAARDAAILQRLVAKDFDPIEWGTLTITDGPNTLKLRVLADGLRMDGVRVVGGSFLIQQMCDVLGLVMLTPKLQDLIFLAAQVQVVPTPDTRGALQTTAAWEDASDRIDKLIAASGIGYTRGSIRRNYGKPWSLDNDAPPGQATNYGWFLTAAQAPGGWWGGIELAQAVTHATTGLWVIQTNRGWMHTVIENEDDYAEMFDATDSTCELNGQTWQTAAIYQHPVYSSLVSHQGPLKFVRQPGVPLYVPAGRAPASADLWLPLPRRASSTSAAALPPLPNATPFASAPPAEVLAWSRAFNAATYPIGTVIRDTVAGIPVIARIEPAPPTMPETNGKSIVALYRGDWPST